ALRRHRPRRRARARGDHRVAARDPRALRGAILALRGAARTLADDFDPSASPALGGAGAAAVPAVLGHFVARRNATTSRLTIIVKRLYIRMAMKNDTHAWTSSE